MNMSSQCLWEKGGSVDINPISIVLQQVSSRKMETLLACVCEGLGEGSDAATQSGYLTERLVEWFHQKYLKKLLEQGREAEITKSLEAELERCLYELGQYGKKKGGMEIQYSGIVIRNNQCWIFQRGATGLLLFNRRYGKEHIRPLVLPPEANVWEGRVQKNVGILLCDEAFGEIFDREDFIEVLFQDKKYEEERMGKRLKELWREGKERGLKKSGAVFVRTY